MGYLKTSRTAIQLHPRTYPPKELNLGEHEIYWYSLTREQQRFCRIQFYKDSECDAFITLGNWTFIHQGRLQAMEGWPQS